MTQVETSTSDLKQAILMLIQDSKETKQRWEERQAKAEAEWKESQAKSTADWEERQAKAAAEAAAERKKLARELGDIARKQGLTAEYFVYPNIERVLREVANLSEEIPVAVSYRIRKLNPDYLAQGSANGVRQQIELDVVAESPSHVLINETKNDLKPEHVQHFLEVL